MESTPLSSILLVLAASFVGSIGAALLKAGAAHLHRDLRSLLANWRLGLGICVFVISSLLYLKGIKRGQLTVLYPMVSLGYVWTLFWSRIFFKEPLNAGKFVGLGMIVLGIVFLALGGR